MRVLCIGKRFESYISNKLFDQKYDNECLENLCGGSCPFKWIFTET